MNGIGTWLKEHISVISFFVAILSSLFALISYLDREQDVNLVSEVLRPIMKDVHDEVLLNRSETLKNREETLTNRGETLKNREIYELTRKQVDTNVGKIDELEKQSVRMETKIDSMMQMLKDIKAK